MKVKIKTLTPVHIGTGKKLGSLEFFKNYRINYDKLFELIAEEKQEEFFNWLDQLPMLTVGDIQSKFGIKDDEIIKKCGLYSFSGSFQRDLNEGIKDSAYKLFIPGSSLKGSLRTALMIKVLKAKPDIGFLLDFFDKLKSKVQVYKGDKNKVKNLLKSADDQLEKEVFICGVVKEKNNRVETVYDDQKFDLMKLIRISDSISVSTEDDCEITELQVYALKKLPAHKTFKTYTESIKQNVELEFDISFDIEFLKKAKIELKNSSSEFGKKYFIGIEKKLKDLFDIDIQKDDEFSEEKIVNSLINSWTDFGSAVSNLEREWVNSIKTKGNASTDSLDKIYSKNNKFKIGFGSGFSGMTILSLLLSNETLKKKSFEFYKSVGIGSHTSIRNNPNPLNINEFPFTRKYSNNQNSYGGFGWVTCASNDTEGNSMEETKIKTVPNRLQNSVLAEIIDDKSKPPKVKIIDGDYKNNETILTGVRLEGLGLSKGDKVYVVLKKNKKGIIEKADFKGNIQK